MWAVRHTFRALAREPVFTLTAVLTIVLGIGANTAVYTVVRAVLLAPPPFRQPGALVQVWETHPELHNLQVSMPDFLDWKASGKTLDLAAYTFQAMNKATLLGQGEPMQVQSAQTSADLFTVLGVHPILGRVFDARQEQAKDPVVLISERLWRSKFAGNPAIIGQSLRLDQTSYSITGVLAQKQAFPVWADVWVPLSFLEPELKSARKYHPLEVIGRLKPGASLQQAETETETIARRLSAAYPETNGKIGAFVVPLVEEMTGRVRPALLAVWAAVGLVLLIACTNLAHLAMARSFDRRRDIAVRLAFGAGRAVALRDFFLETTILSLAGGSLGMLLAAGAMPVLQDLAQGRIPRLEDASLNSSAFLFGLVLSVFVSLLFSAPACWQVLHVDLSRTMASGDSRGASARHSWIGAFLLSSEIALSLAVLLAAVVLVRSFTLTLETNPGFRTDDVLSVNTPLAETWPKSYELFTNRVEPELRTIPGVREVAAVNSAPMSLGPTEHSRFASRFGIVGRTFGPGSFPTAALRWCTANYFETLGIPLERGRLLNNRDYRQVRYVVNQAFAHRYFPQQDAVGQRLLLDVVSPQPTTGEIVGVVGNIHEFGLDVEPEPTLYQVDLSVSMDILVGYSGSPLAITNSVAAALRRISPDSAIGPVRTLHDTVNSSLARQRFALVLMALFAGLGALLCIVGIYGVFGYSVTRRSREFGLRVALGAQRRDLVALILRECLVVAVPGTVAGVLTSIACSSFLRALLYRVSPLDPVSYLIGIVSILGLCMTSALVPALRAARVNPVRVLHEQ